LRKELEVFDDGRNLRQVFLSELLPFICDVLAFGIDDAKHEMTGVLVVGEESILVAVAFPELSG